jgi:hypothetical protein
VALTEIAGGALDGKLTFDATVACRIAPSMVTLDPLTLICPTAPALEPESVDIDVCVKSVGRLMIWTAPLFAVSVTEPALALPCPASESAEIVAPLLI